MYTYINNPPHNTITADGIQRIGENSLYRALNIGRVMAFVGSGMSMEYGRPSWDTLVNKYISFAVDSLVENFDPDDSEFILVWSEFSSFFEYSDEKYFDLLLQKTKQVDFWVEYDKNFSKVLIPLLKILYKLKTYNEEDDIYDIKRHLKLILDVKSDNNKIESLFEFIKNNFNLLKNHKSKLLLIDYIIIFIDKNKILHGFDFDKYETKNIPTKLNYDNEFKISFLDICEEIILWNKDFDERKDEKTNKRNAICKMFFTTDDEALINNFLKANIDKYKSVREKHKREYPNASGVARFSGEGLINFLIDVLNKNVLIESNSETLIYKMNEDIDPLHKLHMKLNINRYLTINYDIEIERMLALSYANKHDASHKNFCENFLNEKIEFKKIEYVRELKNGLQYAIRSSTINEENLGSLFVFGSFPTNFKASVFHLHGRVDDPENMVITLKDYHKLYLKSSEQRKTFDEARQTVFTGSDVLFVGIGMNENDIMIPLRDFANQQRQYGYSQGKIYALMFSDTTDKYRIENAGVIQKLYKNYGVYAIFIDSEDTNKYGLGFREGRMVINKVINAFENNNSDDYEGLNCIYDEYLNEIEEEASISLRIWKRSRIDANYGLGVHETSLIITILQTLKSRLMSRALQKKIESIGNERKKWWLNWQERSGYRESIYGSQQRGGEPVVWVRQKTCFTFPEEVEGDHKSVVEEIFNNNPKLQRLRGLAKTVRAERKYSLGGYRFGVRILRIVGAQGMGQGGLASILSHKIKENKKSVSSTYPFEYIFSNSLHEKEKYSGAFFAHLTFTLEFSSLIFGLVDFIRVFCGSGDTYPGFEKDLRQLDKDKANPSSSKRLFGLTLLKKVLRVFSKIERNKRLFICFSGLDKIVDEFGDAYNPVHREFFRIITDNDSYGKFLYPLDILLIAQKKNFPIRYLSKEIREPIPNTSKDEFQHKTTKGKLTEYIYRDECHTWIRPWDIIEIEHDRDFMERIWKIVRKKMKEIVFNFSHDEKKSMIDYFSLDSGLYFNDFYDECQDLLDLIGQKRVNIFILFSLFFLCTHNKKNNDFEAISNLIKRFYSVYQGAGNRGFLKSAMSVFRSYYLTKIIELHENNKDLDSENEKIIVPVNILDVILRHLVLFSYPVQARVLFFCPAIYERLNYDVYGRQQKTNKNCDFRDEDKEKILLAALDILHAHSLVIRIHPLSKPFVDKNSENQMDFRYTLHRTIAEIIGNDMDFVSQYSPESAPYRTTLYCEQILSRGRPTKEHYEFLAKLIKFGFERTGRLFKISIEDLEGVNLLRKMKNQFSLDNKSEFNEGKFKKEFSQHSDVVRASYAVLRGSFSISSISRMDGTENFYGNPPYETYRSWIRSITHSAIRLSKYKDAVFEDSEDKKKGMTKEEEKKEKEFKQAMKLPFYRDEVSWLYNERGLVSFIQGRLFDAIPLYKQALRTIEGSNEGVTDQSFKSPYRRIQVNLALAEIERGNIRRARTLLDEIIGEIKMNYYSTRSMTLIFAKGYRALCDHLTGNFSQAGKIYEHVIEESSIVSNLRAISIFQRHLADLMRIQDKHDEAKEVLLLSEKSAAQARQEDILHYSLLARARLMRDMDDRREALKILRRAESYGLSMGLDKMTAEALKVRGEIMLSEGEVTQAGLVTAQAIAISKRNGMRLRKISAALIQAKVYSARGQEISASKILDEIVWEADHLGYTLKSGSAQQLRQQLKSM